jgi:sterol desaturase/sphingolipid hydroxylase (fatty acid hydroxylase superfamily)
VLQDYIGLAASVIALSLGFWVLELIIPAQPRQPFRRLAFNIAYAPVILAFVMLAGAASSPVISRLVAHSGGGLLPILVRAESGPLAHAGFALLYALVWDLSQYLMHRLQHASAVLWETHRFHHDETALCAAAQARIHPTSYVLAILFHLPVIVLFGPQAPHFIATFLMFRLWGFLNHANIRVGLGPLTILVSAPQWHRIHHSALPEHRDRNFATFFPVIDWLFGTYYRPKATEYPSTGLGERPDPSLHGATLAPFVAWTGMLRASLRRPRV